MEAQELSFLRRLRDEPGDRDARLVYADWLIERGDPLGEVIQLHLAGSTDVGRIAALVEDVRRRLDASDVSVPDGRIVATWPMQTFLDRGDELLELVPVLDEVVLQRATGDRTETLASRPILRALRRLTISSNVSTDPVGSKGAGALAASPYLDELRGLTLAACRVGPRAGVALFHGVAQRRLEELDLSSNPKLGARTFAAVGQSDLSRFRHLSLAGCRIGRYETAALARGGRAPAGIDLSQNPFGVAGLVTLRPWLAEVERLWIGWCELDWPAIAALRLPRLRFISVGNPSGDAAPSLRAFAEAHPLAQVHTSSRVPDDLTEELGDRLLRR
jgi:uncharacterized protein (TIGR02996 family)